MTEDLAGTLAALALLKARYFRYLDTKQWDLWRELFADDVTFYVDHESAVPLTTTPMVSGADALVEQVSMALRTGVSVHHGHMPELEILGERSASGIWAMVDYLDVPEENRALRGYGHYHDLYEKGDDGRWRIKVSRLTRLRTDFLEPSPELAQREWPPSWKRAAPSRPA